MCASCGCGSGKVDMLDLQTGVATVIADAAERSAGRSQGRERLHGHGADGHVHDHGPHLGAARRHDEQRDAGHSHHGHDHDGHDDYGHGHHGHDHDGTTTTGTAITGMTTTGTAMFMSTPPTMITITSAILIPGQGATVTRAATNGLPAITPITRTVSIPAA